MPTKRASRPAHAGHRATRSRPKSESASAYRRSRRWSGKVTETSDAMDLESGVFKQRSPAAIAASLKRSVERSHRRKAGPYQSAMSMLNFYVNRGGKNLSAAQKERLEKAKAELRKLFGRD